MLLDWLELPGMYEQWKTARSKASGGSTNPSRLSKSKMCSTVIKQHLSKNGVQRTAVQIQNKIG